MIIVSMNAACSEIQMGCQCSALTLVWTRVPYVQWGLFWETPLWYFMALEMLFASDSFPDCSLPTILHSLVTVSVWQDAGYFLLYGTASSGEWSGDRGFQRWEVMQQPPRQWEDIPRCQRW